jgi:hypothetical protein
VHVFTKLDGEVFAGSVHSETDFTLQLEVIKGHPLVSTKDSSISLTLNSHALSNLSVVSSFVVRGLGSCKSCVFIGNFVLVVYN